MAKKIRKDRITQVSRQGEINIPIGHYALIKSNNNPHSYVKKLAIFGLGSCIALLLYDRKKMISAMSHILLAEVKKTKIANPKQYPHKYATLSVKDLFNEMLNHGALKKNIKAVIVGGAEIFKRGPLELGKENILAVKHQLKLFDIQIEKEIVGGTKGRVFIYDFTDNSISIKITGEAEFKKFILKE
ncbi:MAG: chemotaxis protein CheD [Promethearchaeota archaeon]